VRCAPVPPCTSRRVAPGPGMLITHVLPYLHKGASELPGIITTPDAAAHAAFLRSMPTLLLNPCVQVVFRILACAKWNHPKCTVHMDPDEVGALKDTHGVDF
jgi:hypothetical protein